MSSAILHAAGIYGAATHRNRVRCRFCKFSISLSMKDVSAFYQTCKMQDTSRKQHQKPDVSELSDLQFDRSLPLDEEIDCGRERAFGHYIARIAMFDEEFWVAAWLRAETYWEDRPKERYMETYKRQFADQEFGALKKRCAAIYGQKCTCLVVVKKHELNVKRTAVNSIMGTLDISVRHLLPKETFPQVHAKANVCAWTDQRGGRRYGYISNLCVRKSARRQGIASNMVQLAIQVAKSSSVEQVFVHVHRDNVSAQQLYKKIGFEMVEMATSSDDENYLMRSWI